MDVNTKKIADELLEEEDFRGKVQGAVVDSDFKKDLIEGIADDIDDRIEDNPRYKRKVVEELIKKESFKKRLLRELVEELG